MNKFNSLLTRVSGEYKISRGKNESVNQYKIRIIYSLLGRMALASLLDSDEEGNTSIIHMKKRIEGVLKSYREMYPELAFDLPIDTSDLSDEMLEIYLNTGIVYHKPNRLILAAPSEAESPERDICFTRGYNLEVPQKISGIGTYTHEQSGAKYKTINSMFQIESVSLTERWKQIITKVNWSNVLSGEKYEYLRTMPSFRNGYWLSKPEKNGKLSILRTNFQGERQYYIYKYENDTLYTSPLPAWQTEEYQYRSLANACLKVMGTLPPTIYKYDGDIVKLSFGYLPPPQELYLWKLYTWPTSLSSFPHDFNRICDRRVFEAIKITMERLGYEFKEE